jgi:four helix bundle protein
MQTHKDLDIWKLGMDLVEKIYFLTKNFPDDEKFGLTSQMRRASVSFPSNISEGAARNSLKDYIRFLYISLGSLSELETQILISKRLKFLNEKEILSDVEILRKKTLNFIKYLKSKLDG